MADDLEFQIISTPFLLSYTEGFRRLTAEYECSRYNLIGQRYEIQTDQHGETRVRPIGAPSGPWIGELLDQLAAAEDRAFLYGETGELA